MSVSPSCAFVFVTKYRYGIFTKIILDDLKKILPIFVGLFEAKLVELDEEDDYVYLLAVYLPRWPFYLCLTPLKGCCPAG